MKIAFLEARNLFDLQEQISNTYKQLKAYLNEYSKYSSEISMRFYANIDDIPADIEIIGISSTSQNYLESIAMGTKARQKYSKALIILGGHHISYFPDSLPTEFDLGVMHEGEQTFLEIVDSYIESGKNINRILNIKGIIYRNQSGELVINPPQILISPLDKIPFPVIEGDEPPYLFSSRGCPYDCSFCFSTLFWQKFRNFSADHVVKEIENILKHNPKQKNIKFWDDLVIADKKRLISIVEQLEAKGITKRVSFDIAVRANLINEDMSIWLKRMNVTTVGVGFESASPRVLEILKGKSVTIEMNQTALDLLSKQGIVTGGSFVVGAPTETQEEVRKTFDFILNNILDGKLSFYVVNILMPLPGTAMWEYAIENGIIQEPIDWRRMQVFSDYKNSNISDFSQWLEFRKQNRSYYLNEKYIPEDELLKMLHEFETMAEKLSNLMHQTRNLRKMIKFGKHIENGFKQNALISKLRGIIRR